MVVRFPFEIQICLNVADEAFIRCSQWKTLKSQHERQMAEHQKLPSSQIPGFSTAVQRRDGSTSRGGSQKLGADNSPSTGGITLLGAQKSTTRPWPQCSYRRIFDDF